MQPVKVTYILSHIHKALEHEWLVEMIDKNKIELSFILMNPGETEMERFLIKNNIPVFRINYSGKKNLPSAFFQIIRLLKKIKPGVVHTHLFDANIAGLSAAKMVGIKKRIMTRHHATYHHEYFPHAVKYDKWVQRLATHIVAISKNVQQVLIEMENVAPEKISVIHHGLKLDDFENVPAARVSAMKKKYNTENNFPVVGVISRYFHLKGIEYTIDAFGKLLGKYPDAKLILANASGNYKSEIQNALKKIPEKNYSEIIFENDLAGLYRLFDIFIHVPINSQIEAFGQIYIESLAMEIPSIFTLSGIASEFVEHRKHALVVDYKSAQQICESMMLILTDKNLTSQMKANGKKFVDENFSVQKKIKLLEALYLS